ncbi:LVIVD repeat-containing protein [Spirochaeta thermophila DSM 6578]|uniref:LVIVD repeat-containing protein n=1 Tax=Winmispira thermophila (strain ATCC 700085 / DSM 6578 / Z-1203) TaxID=869211 RepID=G0GB38_WINT7|nr:LVIVD repeat-containing protein [Spirochaeta thermophila]AEJ61062.1 LVIVD repeat-containing protein [Spirochaeta thermophila DSM 6578]
MKHVHVILILTFLLLAGCSSPVGDSDPVSPGLSVVGDLGVGSAVDVAVDGHYAYLTTYVSATLKIVDVADPSSPVLVSTTFLPGDVSAHGLDVAFGYAYVTNEGAFRVINVSDKENPAVEGSITLLSQWPVDVMVEGTYAYVAWGPAGLGIVDVSSPSNLTMTGWLDTAGDARAVVKEGHYVYLADGDNGLLIVDVSTPSQPVAAAQVSGFTASALTLMGGYAYVGTDGDGLVVVNVTDPSSPQQVAQKDVNGGTNTVYAVAASDSYLYLSDAERIAMLDVSNPASPVEVASLSLPYVGGLEIHGGYLYAGGDQGSSLIQPGY